jgi:hypothetical protein
MQFMILAYDGTDENAPARRMAAREAHIELGKEMHAAGRWLYATAILDDDGKMIGSMIVCDFASRSDMQKQWLSREPYIIGKVWEKIDIRSAQTAPFCTAK